MVVPLKIYPSFQSANDKLKLSFARPHPTLEQTIRSLDNKNLQRMFNWINLCISLLKEIFVGLCALVPVCRMDHQLNGTLEYLIKALARENAGAERGLFLQALVPHSNFPKSKLMSGLVQFQIRFHSHPVTIEFWHTIRANKNRIFYDQIVR